MEFCRAFKKIDFFGKEPEFYLKGRSKLTSWFGRIFTYIFIILYIVIFAYKLYRMYQRVDITFYDSYSNTDEVPEIRVTQDNFSLVFAIFDGDGKPFINERIYYPTAYFNGEEQQNINIEVCNPDKINPKYIEYLKDYDISHFYCLTDIDHIFKPYINSLVVEIYPCKNEEGHTDQCDPNEDIDAALNERIFMVYFEDIILTPLNYDDPIKERINYLSSDIYKVVGQYLYTELQLVKIETSTNIIGFEFLTEPKLEEFVKFDKELSYTYPGYDLDDEENEEPVNVFEIQLNDKVLLEKRQYIKLIDVLGEIGGLMEMVDSLFTVICSLVVNILYDRKITNNLFSFNIDKKLVLIKRCKELKDSKDYKDSKDSETKFNNDKIIEVDNIIEKKLFKKTKKRKKIQKREPSKEDIVIIKKNNKNINNINNLNSGNILKIDLTEKKFRNEKKSRISSDMFNDTTIINKNDQNNNNIGLITKMSLKEVLLSKCACGKRNKKKIYNILIDESMNIIRKKLDIINIFRNICLIEHSHNDLNLNKDSDIIKMSKKCESDLSEIAG